MTAQLSRIVYRIGSPENDRHHFTEQKDHADIAKNNGYEVSEYVLAGMDSETSFGEHMTLIDKGRLMMLEDSHKTLLDYRADNVWYWQGDEDDQPESLGCRVIMSAETLRNLLAKSAPPAPVAVPDEAAVGEMSFLGSGEASYVRGWNDFRAAMLKAGPVTAATVPDGWKLVPVEPTAEMISSGITAHYERSQIQIHDRPAPGPMECGYLAMLAAAPAAPEQE